MKKFFIVISLLVATVPLWAQFVINSAVGGSTEIFRGNIALRDGEFVSESYSGFTSPTFSDTNFSLEYNWEDTAGFVLKLNAPTNLKDWGDKKVFEGTYGWLRFGDIARLEAGLFSRRKANKVNNVLDEWSLGYVTAGGELIETDALSHFIVDVYAGPVAIEFAPVQELGIDFLNANEDSTGTSAYTRKFHGAVRLSGTIFDMIQLTSVYSPQYSWRSELQKEPTDFQPDIISFGHRYAFFVNTVQFQDFDFMLGYSGSLQQEGRKGDADLISNISNVYHGIDVRAGINLLDKMRLESHHNFTFGSNLNGTYEGMVWKDGLRQKSFSSRNGVGIRYRVTDNMDLDLIVSNKYRLEYKDDNDQLYENIFQLKPSVKYFFNEKIFVKTGVTLEYKVSQDNKAGVKGTKYEDFIPSIPISFCIGF